MKHCWLLVVAAVLVCAVTAATALHPPSFLELSNKKREERSLTFDAARMAEARARRSGSGKRGIFDDLAQDLEKDIPAAATKAGNQLGQNIAVQFEKAIGITPQQAAQPTSTGLPRPPVIVPGVPPQAINPKAPPSPSQMINQTDLICVFCQYLVQRARGEMLMNGIGGGIPFAKNRPFLVGRQEARFDSPSDAFQGPPPRMEKAPRGPFDGAQYLPSPNGVGSMSLSGPAALLETEAEAEAEAEGPGSSSHSEESSQMSPYRMNLAQYLAKKQAERLLGITWMTGREREVDAYKFRPTQRRFANLYDGPLRAARRAEDRYEDIQMYSLVYQTIEDVCTKKSPKAFYPACLMVLREYKQIAQGLKWKDRPDSICMEMTYCDSSSYIRRSPHSVYRDY